MAVALVRGIRAPPSTYSSFMKGPDICFLQQTEEQREALERFEHDRDNVVKVC